MRFKAIWADNPPASKFLIALGMLIMGFFFFSTITLLMASVFYGLNTEQLQDLLNDIDNPLTLSILKMMQAASAVGTFILPAIFLAYVFSPDSGHYLRLDKKARWDSVILVFILLIVAVPVINFLGEMNSRLVLPDWMNYIEEKIRSSEERAAKLTQKFLMIETPMQIISTIMLIAVLPALSEELMFRGVIQRIFHEWSGNKHTGIWASAILFSAMHFQFYGFVPRLLLGVMLGYLFLWSGSLWLPIIAHFINNAAAVIAFYMYNHEKLSINPDTIGTGSQYGALLISMVLTASLLFAVYKIEQRRTSRYPAP